jgi:tRNA/tmRNA/rRNA uracil-C5-methylase (TrmA/RlmC/RlmD family)
LPIKDYSSFPNKIWCWWCKWQVVSHENQLKLKQEIVADAFKKLKNKILDFNFFPIIWTWVEKWYRNKIEFSFGKFISHDTTYSDWSLGFHKQWEFSKIIDIDSCWLISSQANEIFQHIKNLCFKSKLPVYDQKTHQWFFRHLVIRQGINTGQFLVNLSVSDDNLKKNLITKRNSFLEKLKKDEYLKKNVTTFVITYNNWLADTINSPQSQTKTFRGDGYIYETLKFQISKQNNFNANLDTNLNDNWNINSNWNLENNSDFLTSLDNANLKQIDVNFRVAPFSFFQTNTLWAQLLFSESMKIVWNVQWLIFDLYCWTGSIWLSFLKVWKWEKLIWIEISQDAIIDAQYNSKINWLEEKSIFITWASEKALIQNPTLRDKLKDIWLVIIDPPRDWLHKNVITLLSELKKESDFKLLYISCNPITMARDIELLSGQWFQLKLLQPVDMFPQTHHIEVIWLLQ